MRPINRLIALGVRNAKRSGDHSDGGGLVLQVAAAGAKSWIFRYRFAGKSHEMGLGSCQLVGRARARELALGCRQLLLEGRDPLSERRQDRATRIVQQARRLTFDQCAAAYIKAHQGGWRNPKHAARWQSTLATYATPVIGALPVSEIDTDLVVKVLAPIWNTKTETATRLRGRIESDLDWATVSRFRQGENPARWHGHLDYLLANPNKVAPLSNHPALP